MGVPKFYRWLSERYPLINQLISDGRMLPEFDNLYLDMNGIIHACTHPSDNEIASTLSTREMILGIFRYIERTVNVIVKPKKLLFIAVDGVAPRAKLNQQRSRRFRAAEERVASVEKAKQRGETVDESKIFDSNCITPGTEFMEMVGNHIRWYIRKKVKEDPMWRDLEVIFSGHDVPGEGEHKIMQYIRDQRAMPNYEPNIRHCMLGQDADLIMLGLVSHEPHFTLLREVIEFGGRKFMSTRQTVVKQTRDAKFQLLHLSVLREYIEVEFFGASTPTFALERERLIDDFVFLTFLVGNDFLPHLPTLDISENAFDVVFDAYKSVLKVDPGYLVENGEIKSFGRLEKLFAVIGKQEQDILEKRETEAIKFASRNRRRGGGHHHKEEAEEKIIDDMEKEIRAMQLREDADTTTPPHGLIAAAGATVSSSGEDTESETSGVETDVTESESERSIDTSLVGDAPIKEGRKDYRTRYYAEKFKIPIAELMQRSTVPVLEDLKQTYMSGLIWCLAYYCKGCVSWTWYFPYHYGPMLQDMDNLEAVAARIEFNLSEPFKPFQQLLGCLPPASATLLPAAYQWLMIGDHSPLKDCYPDTFEVDMNGKKSPWEAVVLLPFIDEKKLLQAEAEHCSVAAAAAMGRPLHKSDLRRNEFGRMLRVRYSPSCMDTVPFPHGYADLGFTDIVSCQTEAVNLMYDIKPGVPFRPEIITGTVCPYPGFPSLSILPIAGTRTQAVKLNIFGSPSRYKSMIIDLQSSKNPFDPGTIDLSLLLGKTVYVNYPLCFEARVVSVETGMKQYRCSKDLVRAGSKISPDMVSVTNKGSAEAHAWSNHAEDIQSGYLAGQGIPGTGGLNIGPVTLTLGVVPLQGMERDFATGARTKVFGKDEAVVPIQLALWSCPVSSDPRYEETGAMPLRELFPYGVDTLVIAGHYAGYMGKVVGPHGPKSSAEDKALQGGAKARMSLKKEASSSSKQNTNDGRQSSYLLDVEFSIPAKEPDFGLRIAEAVQDRYFSSRDVCRMTQLSPGVLGQIVGAVLLEASDGKEIDIGLNFRRNGQYQLLGYCRRVQGDGQEAAYSVISKRVWHERNDTMQIIGSAPDELDMTGESLIPKKSTKSQHGDKSNKGKHGSKEAAKAPVEEEKTYWEYSSRAVDLIKEYKKRFGFLFNTLEKTAHQRKHSITGLLGPKGETLLDEIVTWMKAQPFFSLPRTPLATISLCTDAIAALENASSERIAAEASAAESIAPIVAHGIPSDLLFRGDIYAPTDVPPVFENPKYPRLGYRVVNVTSSLVPFGYKGTIVAIHGSSGFVEVLFDKEFAAGRPVIGARSKFRSALIPWAACLCTTSVDASTGKVSSRGHKHNNEQASRRQHGQATASSKARPAPLPTGPGAKANKDIEGLRSLLKRPVNHAPAATAAPTDRQVPSVSEATTQPDSLMVSTRAPESLGGFRIIHRVGAGGASAPSGEKQPSSKKEKQSRKSDGTGFAALAAAATAVEREDETDAKPSSSTEEKAEVPPVQSNVGKKDKKAKVNNTSDKKKADAQMLLSALKPAAKAPEAAIAAPDAPEKKGDEVALKSLLTILKTGGNKDASVASEPPAPVPGGPETANAPAQLPKKASSKMVPASVLLKQKKTNV